MEMLWILEYGVHAGNHLGALIAFHRHIFSRGWGRETRHPDLQTVTRICFVTLAGLLALLLIDVLRAVSCGSMS
jgi:hypothetical protein